MSKRVYVVGSKSAALEAGLEVVLPEQAGKALAGGKTQFGADLLGHTDGLRCLLGRKS